MSQVHFSLRILCIKFKPSHSAIKGKQNKKNLLHDALNMQLTQLQLFHCSNYQRT